MGQSSTKPIKDHVVALEGAGYKLNEKLVNQLQNSLTKLNMIDDKDDPAIVLVSTSVETLETDQCSKKDMTSSQPVRSKPKFFIHCYNGSHIVLPLLTRLDWNRVSDRKEAGSCCFRWTETVMQLNYQVFKESEQMVNHIPNCGLFTNKLGLLMSLRSYAKKVNYNGGKENPINFIPETYWLDDPKEKTEFVSRLSRDNEIWIMKPCGLNQGKGICLIRSKEDFYKIEEARDEDIRHNLQVCRARIVQKYAFLILSFAFELVDSSSNFAEKRFYTNMLSKYLVTPLLLNKRKFDIRCFLMIVSTMPYLVLFAPGYIRLSLRKYDLSDLNLITHLTNQPEMRRISTNVFNAVKNELACRIGFFEIYGMDFMIDDDMKVWLIEINSNPAMKTNCEVLRQVIPPIVSRFIHISIECFEKARRWRPILPIVGILPRSTTDIKSERNSLPWNVSLKPPQMYATNAGLPSSFVILYNENLTTAKSRQNKCYSVPLSLWVPPKMCDNIRLPKPGLVIRQSGSPPLPHVPVTINKPPLLSLKQLASSQLPVNLKALPQLELQDAMFPQTFSLSTKEATDQAESLDRSSKKKQSISSNEPDKSIANKEETTNLHEKTEDAPQEHTRMFSRLSKRLSRKSDESSDTRKNPEKPRNSPKISNDLSKVLQLIKDSKFGDRKPGQQDSFEILKEEEHEESNNNFSEDKKPSLRESREIENKNDSCSVKFPSMVPEYAFVSITPITIPPIPPRVTALTSLTEAPAEERDGDADDETMNNASSIAIPISPNSEIAIDQNFHSDGNGNAAQNNAEFH
ncbi:hypothetical protein Aperf_G00000014310 [Anoplocephala perfoliata]